MGFEQRPEYTGEKCSGGHDEYVVIDTLDGQFVTEHGPRCWVGGCPDNEAKKAAEQPGSGG